jgi:mannose-1-phosphate guanylyltransferase/mannose-6-phosphate isomerase
MKKIIPPENIYLITNRENFFNALNQIKEIADDFKEAQIIVEPKSLDTAPAIALATRYLVEKVNINPEETIIEVHSDHYITEENKFLELARLALRETGDNVGAIGITPAKAETGYGYIKKGKKKGSHFSVSRFVEKPDHETASGYVASGDYLWNAGIYLFTPKTLARELELHAPEIFSIYKKDYKTFLKNFSSLGPISFDVAISEKSSSIIVFEGDFGWNDIGSFDSLAELNLPGANPRHISIDSKNIFIQGSGDRLVATVGVEDLIIVDSSDSILIQKKGRSQEVKKVVERLKEKGMKEVEHNLIGYRPWGKYEVLIDRPNHKVKKLIVYPGAKLSLQSHERRAEHWVVIKGTAKIVNGGKETSLKKNESTFIPVKTKHRLSNPGKADLEIIEVQTGDYLEEDDIRRYDDVYNRL